MFSFADTESIISYYLSGTMTPLYTFKHNGGGKISGLCALSDILLVSGGGGGEPSIFTWDIGTGGKVHEWKYPRILEALSGQ